MSIEAPEAALIAGGMRDLVIGKRIENWDVRESERLARSGFINRDLHDFDALKERRIEAVASRGNTVLAHLDRGVHLILAPEYGGVVLFHASGAAECRVLYRTIRTVLSECIQQGGKEGFVDLHGKPGRFRPAAGPAGAKSPCPRCGARFAKVAVCGGPSYYCPACQPAPSSR